MLRFDDEGSRRLVAAYLTPDVVAQRRSVRGWLELRPGERVLDVGVGPGFLAAEMAGEVGADGLVAGIDVLPVAERGLRPGAGVQRRSDRHHRRFRRGARRTARRGGRRMEGRPAVAR
jgi:SAM-dependent methyltransferase